MELLILAILPWYAIGYFLANEACKSWERRWTSRGRPDITPPASPLVLGLLGPLAIAFNIAEAMIGQD